MSSEVVELRKLVLRYLKKTPVYKNGIKKVIHTFSKNLNMNEREIAELVDILLWKPPYQRGEELSKIVEDYETLRSLERIIKDFKEKLLLTTYVLLHKRNIVDEKAAEILGESKGKIVEIRKALGLPPVKQKYERRRSFFTPAKNRVREMFKKFLESSILKERSPSEVKVLHLPGIENLEVWLVYDKLGIPRENIWGVEIEEESYEWLKFMESGINLVYGDIRYYLKQTDETFDVINLDLSGPPKTLLECIDHVFKRELLTESSVLGVTYLRGREKKSGKKEMRREALRIGIEKLLFGDELLRDILLERYKRIMSGEIIPRDEVVDVICIEASTAIIRKKVEELGFNPSYDGLYECIDKHEDELLEMLRRGYLPRKVKTVNYRSGRSPMTSAFFYFEKGIDRYENFPRAIHELFKIVSNVPIEEERVVGKETRRTIFTPRPLSNEDKKAITDELKRLTRIWKKRVETNEVDEIPRNRINKAIALQYACSPGQVVALKSWITMREGWRNAT